MGYIYIYFLQKSYCLGLFGHYLQNEIFCQKSSSFTFFTITGYLRHKMITSQNVASEAQVKIFFCFTEKLWSFLRYASFRIFNIPTIY